MDSPVNFENMLDSKIFTLKLLLNRLHEKYRARDVDVRDYDKCLKITVLDPCFEGIEQGRRYEMFDLVLKDLPLDTWYETIIYQLSSPKEVTNHFVPINPTLN